MANFASNSSQSPPSDNDRSLVQRARSYQCDVARYRDNRRAAKRAPKANRSRGPKLLAAEAPMKCNPGIDDSKSLDSAGMSPSERICERSPSSMNGMRL